MATENESCLTDLQEKKGSMQRIVVVGTSGSGKTTLARQLGTMLSIPAVELDALHWEPNWTAVSLPILRERVEAALSGDGWVVDGNYSKVRDLTWERADTIVWLDYRLWVIMARLILRTFTRILTRKELWNGNQESLGTTLFSKDSILLWALQTYRKNRRAYSQIASQPEYAHLTVVRHRTPRATRAWLAEIKQG